MQKLEERQVNTPTDAPQVRSNCDSVVKHDREVGQVLQNKKTFSNISDVDRSQHAENSDLRVQNVVYVLNMRGQPLMPTTQQKANKILKQGKAKVVSRKPFTIQLKYATGETKQDITLGIDAGYKNVGFSVVSKKAELISGELILRSDVPKKMEQRSNYRRTRRAKLWHRPPRFNNRGIPKGWLAPSIQHKLDSHIRLIDKIGQLLPISNVIIEVAAFDIQKIKDPDIESEQYQQGEQLGFWNLREYVLHRDNHTCQHCKGKKKDKILQVHHINGKEEGATDRPEELLTVCMTCHKEHHKGIDIIPKKKIKNFKPETFMTMVRWRLVNILNCKHTYGHITKNNRIKQNILKSHANDAFIIAGGTEDTERTAQQSFKQVRRNNRSIQTNRKGFKPSIRRQRYSIQPNDLLQYKGREHRSKGIFSYGTQVRLVDQVGNIVNCNTKKVELIHYGKGIFN
ncbi:MAG: RNA-guided endonuclease IscB [Bacteroidota bacterium]|nr:RNA-guided endonuclease IscB [Bacteroidota bacterium]